MRVETTTPIQGLYALNGPLLLRQATELASRLNRGGELETEAALHRIYGWLFYREPSERELAAGIAFLDVQHAQLSTERWQQYLHVLLASNELMFLD
jgi:TorA maturation chaperone TorD